MAREDDVERSCLGTNMEGERGAMGRGAVDLMDRGEEAGSVDRAGEIPRGDLV